MAEFDRFSDGYADKLDECIAYAGEGGTRYFAKTKALHAARLLGAGFSGRILDYGCGVGALAEELAAAFPNARVDGFDVSADSLKRVPAALSSRGLFTGDEAALPRDYDLAVVCNVLHHVPPAERPALAASLAGRLAPGGRLLVFEHNPLNPLTRKVVRECVFDEGAIMLWPRETRRLLERAGLSGVRTDYLSFVPPALPFLRALEPALAWCPLGAQYAVVGRKSDGR